VPHPFRSLIAERVGKHELLKNSQKTLKTAQKQAKIGLFCWVLDGVELPVSYSYRAAYIHI
jgi:hypothetical protein